MRIIKELPEMQHLEKQVAETAAVVTEWNSTIAKIETQLNAAGLALAKAKQEGEIHALKASTGDAAAIAAKYIAWDAQRDAESTIADLRVALPKAFSQLAEAEQATENARRALAKPHREAKMRERVAISARIDKRNAENAADYELHRRLGLELLNDLAQDGGMMSRYEDLIGLKRISAAMPACLKTLPATDPTKFVPLAVSEAQFWSLPPEQPAKAA